MSAGNIVKVIKFKYGIRAEILEAEPSYRGEAQWTYRVIVPGQDGFERAGSFNSRKTVERFARRTGRCYQTMLVVADTISRKQAVRAAQYLFAFQLGCNSNEVSVLADMSHDLALILAEDSRPKQDAADVIRNIVEHEVLALRPDARDFVFMYMEWVEQELDLQHCVPIAAMVADRNRRMAAELEARGAAAPQPETLS